MKDLDELKRLLAKWQRYPDCDWTIYDTGLAMDAIPDLIAEIERLRGIAETWRQISLEPKRPEPELNKILRCAEHDEHHHKCRYCRLTNIVNGLALADIRFATIEERERDAPIGNDGEVVDDRSLLVPLFIYRGAQDALKETMAEAGARIERLEAALREIEDCLEHDQGDRHESCVYLARAALEDEKK